ncbi:MAG: hypothetical protein KC425_15540 [Anaerolineales bacterium]|nr:hypothetical protein [Anaerolineales bacterium]
MSEENVWLVLFLFSALVVGIVSWRRGERRARMVQAFARRWQLAVPSRSMARGEVHGRFLSLKSYQERYRRSIRTRLMMTVGLRQAGHGWLQVTPDAALFKPRAVEDMMAIPFSTLYAVRSRPPELGLRLFSEEGDARLRLKLTEALFPLAKRGSRCRIVTDVGLTLTFDDIDLQDAELDAVAVMLIRLAEALEAA